MGHSAAGLGAGPCVRRGPSTTYSTEANSKQQTGPGESGDVNATVTFEATPFVRSGNPPQARLAGLLRRASMIANEIL